MKHLFNASLPGSDFQFVFYDKMPLANKIWQNVITLNSLGPGKCGYNLELIIFSIIQSYYDKIWMSSIDFHCNIDGLVQDCSNSIANALELLQSCTKPSIWSPDLCSC